MTKIFEHACYHHMGAAVNYLDNIVGAKFLLDGESIEVREIINWQIVVMVPSNIYVIVELSVRHIHPDDFELGAVIEVS